MTRFIKDIIKLIFWYPLRWMLSFFPLQVVYFMGTIGGCIHLALSRKIRGMMEAELSSIHHGKYTKEQRRAIIRKTFILMAKNLLEVLLFRYLTPKRTARMITVEGLDKLDDALSKRKGVILLISHFGANKLVMPALGYRGYKINQVAGKPTEWIKIMGKELSVLSKKNFELEMENDQSLPANFIYVFKSMKPIFKCLKNNEIVCMAIDGGGGTKKEKIPFLGRTALISAGPFRIAQKTGAVILPAFVVRQRDNRHKLTIENPMVPAPDAKEEVDSTRNLLKFMEIFEKYVNQHPCHYMHRLAKARVLYQKDLVPLFSDYERGGELCN